MYKLKKEKVNKILQEAEIVSDDKIIVKQITGEDSSYVFRIDYSNSTYALKIFLNSKSEFYANKKFNELLIGNNIATPKIIHSNDDCKLIPSPFVLWEWASGKLLCKIDSDTDRLNYAIEAGEQLLKIHKIKISGFGYPNEENKWSGENIGWTIDFFVERINRLISKGGKVFSENELSKILSATTESQELFSVTEAHLLHGDITGGNVIVSDSNEITFIDPGEIIAGDPMADLGYSQITSLNPVFREGIWKGYTDKTPLTVEERARFLRWRLLRQAVITCRAFLNKDENAETYANDARLFLKEI